MKTTEEAPDDVPLAIPSHQRLLKSVRYLVLVAVADRTEAETILTELEAYVEDCYSMGKFDMAEAYVREAKTDFRLMLQARYPKASTLLHSVAIGIFTGVAANAIAATSVFTNLVG